MSPGNSDTIDDAVAGFARRYGNCPAAGEDPVQSIYGDDRPVDVKTRYDPGNPLHVNQNVTPRTGGDR